MIENKLTGTSDEIIIFLKSRVRKFWNFENSNIFNNYWYQYLMKARRGLGLGLHHLIYILIWDYIGLYSTIFSSSSGTALWKTKPPESYLNF